MDNEAFVHSLQDRVRQLSRIEKSFYLSIIVTGIIIAISVIFLQSRQQQLEQDITSMNRDIANMQTELNNAKQEVNELTRYERISEIAQSAGLTVSNNNIQAVEEE